MISLTYSLASLFQFWQALAHFGTIFTHEFTHQPSGFSNRLRVSGNKILPPMIPPLFKKWSNRSKWTTAASSLGFLIPFLDRFALDAGQFVYLLGHHCPDEHGRTIDPYGVQEETLPALPWFIVAEPLNLSGPLPGSSPPLPPMTVNPPRSLSTRHMIRKPGMKSLRLN